MKKPLLVIILLLSQSILRAQEQITDFQPILGDKSSSPLGFVEVNNLVLFTATTEDFGREIWVSNGNIDEAYMLKDINKGKENGVLPSLSSASVILDGFLYFIAQDEFSNGELWKTDGTNQGTIKVTSFLNTTSTKLTVVGNKIFFLKNEDYKLEVWKSDGSEAGTELVIGDIPMWNSPTFQGELNGLLIFTFQSYGTNNSRVWRSDGTSSGTFPITEEIDGNGSGPNGTSALSQYVKYDNQLYFVSRYYLHKTDGTLENTSIITSLYRAGTELINYSDAIEVNGKLYFLFFQYDYQRLFIWEFNPPSSGVAKIFDQFNSQKFLTSNLIGHQNNLYFVGANNTGGTSLLKINLSNKSVENIKELDDGTTLPLIYSFFSSTYRCYLQKASGENLFCSIPYKTHNNRKGWVSGYTNATTFETPNLNNVTSIINHDNAFVFSKDSANIGRELWKSDGTNEGTFLIDNINKSKYGITVNNIGTLNNKLIFSANDGVFGEELWVYKDNSLSLLKDINSGIKSSMYANSFVNFKDELYFIANDGTLTSLWKTDGTPFGTKMAIDMEASDSITSFLNLYAENNGYLYFFASNSIWQYKLYRTDGTTTEFIKELGANIYNVPLKPESIVASGNYIYFTTTNGGDDLWGSDGTSSGTEKIRNFYSCSKLTAANNKLFFVASELNGEKELWSSSGTETLTNRVRDIGNGYSSEPDHLIAFNNALYFTAYTTENGREIWHTVDNALGATILLDINASSKSSLSNPSFCILNNNLFFKANNGTSGSELWKTNGDFNDATLVKDINIGPESSFPTELTKIKDLIYFQGYTEENGIELWKTNGTSEGTVLDMDLSPGMLSSSPTKISSIGDALYFIGEKPSTGLQIWKSTYDTSLHNENYTSALDFSIFPNPTEEFINIKSNYLQDKIEIYDLTGKQVDKKTLLNNQINISNLTPGIYLIKFKTDHKIITKKIIKR